MVAGEEGRVMEGAEEALEGEDGARDPERAGLLVPVLLRRPVEEADEKRMVEQLRAHHVPLHLLPYVHRQVPLRHRRRRRPPPRAAAAGAEEDVPAGRVGDPGEPPHELPHGRIGGDRKRRGGWNLEEELGGDDLFINGRRKDTLVHGGYTY